DRIRAIGRWPAHPCPRSDVPLRSFSDGGSRAASTAATGALSRHSTWVLGNAGQHAVKARSWAASGDRLRPTRVVVNDVAPCRESTAPPPTIHFMSSNDRLAAIAEQLGAS